MRQKVTELIHGKSSTYRGRGCRCEECRAANRVRQRITSFEASERFAKGLVEAEHGRANTYRYWGCRCELCTDAHMAAVNDWKRRKGEEKIEEASIDDEAVM